MISNVNLGMRNALLVYKIIFLYYFQFKQNGS